MPHGSTKPPPALEAMLAYRLVGAWDVWAEVRDLFAPTLPQDNLPGLFPTAWINSAT